MRKKTFLFIIISGVLFAGGFLKFNIQKRVELKYLKPYSSHITFVASDEKGNIFVSQRGRDSFVEILKGGGIEEKSLGEYSNLLSLDTDNEGNVVIMASKKNWPFLIWLDPETGKVLRAMDLFKKFISIRDVKVLHPKNLIMIIGVPKDESLRKFSHHILDFQGNFVTSFFELKNKHVNLDSIMEANLDNFGGCPPRFDYSMERIYLCCPVSSTIKIFDYHGNKIGEVNWPERGLFFVKKGKIYVEKRSSKSAVIILPGKGTEEMEIWDSSPGIPKGSDVNGNLFFLGGERGQILILASVEE